MNTISVAGYAKACSVSRQTIYTDIHRGNVVQRGDGKIDLDNITNAQYKIDRSGNNKKPGPEPKSEPEIQNKLSFTIEDLEGVENLIDFDKAPKTSIDKLKTLEQARTIKFNYEKERGKYVLRTTVDKVLNQIWIIDGMQFKNLADTLPDDIGVIFNTDEPELLLKINELLHFQFNRLLVQIKEKVDKFIKEESN